MPLRLLIFLTTLLHVYIGVRLFPSLSEHGAIRALLLAAIVVSAATMPLPFAGRHSRERRRQFADGWKWIGLLSMGWFSSRFVLTVVRDAGLLLAWLATVVFGWSLDWTRWLAASAL